MTTPVLTGQCAREHRHALPSPANSLILLLQRSPLVKILMPEPRITSSSGFPEAMRSAVTAVARLGAFDSVPGVTTVLQIAPAPR